MAEVFVDTSGWVCHLDSSQRQHADAVTLLGVCLAQGDRLVTTNYVITEAPPHVAVGSRCPPPQKCPEMPAF